VSWLPFVFLAIGGFLAGGAWSMRRQGRTGVAWLLAAMSFVALLGGLIGTGVFGSGVPA
jgi:hypothetical protein